MALVAKYKSAQSTSTWELVHGGEASQEMRASVLNQHLCGSFYDKLVCFRLSLHIV